MQNTIRWLIRSLPRCPTTNRWYTEPEIESVRLAGGDYGYEISGTDYKVKANTKRRANSKKYTDPKYKKLYKDTVSKYMTVYY